MDKCYGDVYSTRSSDDGYGDRNNDNVEAVLEKKGDMAGELMRDHDEMEDTSKMPYSTTL